MTVTTTAGVNMMVVIAAARQEKVTNFNIAPHANVSILRKQELNAMAKDVELVAVTRGLDTAMMAITTAHANMMVVIAAEKKISQYQYCTACSCKDPSVVGKSCPGVCGAGGTFKGDGYCDDGNNNCGCQYDGGDCCGKSGKKSQFKYCKTCTCQDPAIVGQGC